MKVSLEFTNLTRVTNYTNKSLATTMGFDLPYLSVCSNLQPSEARSWTMDVLLGTLMSMLVVAHKIGIDYEFRVTLIGQQIPMFVTRFKERCFRGSTLMLLGKRVRARSTLTTDQSYYIH